jgi:hypothetical protein
MEPKATIILADDDMITIEVEVNVLTVTVTAPRCSPPQFVSVDAVISFRVLNHRNTLTLVVVADMVFLVLESPSF